MGRGRGGKSPGVIDEVLWEVPMLIRWRLMNLFGCRHLNDTEVGVFCLTGCACTN